MSLHDWLGAFVLTQMIEVPVYLLFSSTLPWNKRLWFAFGASTITHPIIWFALPWAAMPYAASVILAEAFAISVEAIWGRAWHVRRPWMASLIANALSASIGMLVRDVWTCC